MGEIILGHLIGDYLLQNDWMAANKKHSNLICVLHCTIWTISIILFAGWTWYWSSILFATHFIQDRWFFVGRWMDIIGQKQFRTGACAPWSMIIIDNIFHLIVIWGLWRWCV